MYSDPLKAVNRKINDNVVVTSCPFSINNKYDFGARMLSFSYDDDKIIVYSPVPYGEAVIKAFQMLTNSNKTVFNVTHVIISNVKHNLVAESYKKVFPETKLVGSDRISYCDIKFTNDMANQIFASNKYSELNISDSGFTNNLELIYLSYHINKEIVVYEKTSKTLITCDSFVNFHGGELEQYCPELGFPKGYTPLTGYSYWIRFLSPQSWLWSYVMGPKVNNTKKPEAVKGLKLVSKWDFVRIEVIHGNCIEEDAKNKFKSCFGIDDI